MPFIKKDFIQFIYKEKSGTVTKLTLVQKKRNQKFMKHNQLYFDLWYWHRTFIAGITHKIRTPFKTLASKKITAWRLKQSQSNDKLLLKVISSSCHIEQKPFSELSCTNNTHLRTGFLLLPLLQVCESFLSRQTKKNMWYTLVCLSIPCIFSGKKAQQILLVRGKFSFLYIGI